MWAIMMLLLLVGASALRPQPQRFAIMMATPSTPLSSRSTAAHQVQSLLSASLPLLLLPTVSRAIDATATDNPAPARYKGKSQFEYQPALQGLDYGKPRTYYPDFEQKPSGLQYKVVKEGTGRTPKKGDKVVVDWEGYTIGYYGRPFQTRNKVKGGAFDATDGETDFLRWIVGDGTIVAALDEGIKYMKEGGVTQFIVPAELGYPSRGDSDHKLVGPAPTTFSGMRALNFVLDNQNLIDKTLLINIRLVKIKGKGDE